MCVAAGVFRRVSKRDGNNFYICGSEAHVQNVCLKAIMTLLTSWQATHNVCRELTGGASNSALLFAHKHTVMLVFFVWRYIVLKFSDTQT